MIADTGTLTTVLKEFLAVFKLGQQAVSKDAVNLISIIAAIELTLTGLWLAYTGSDALEGIIRKILLISFFIFVIDQYDTLLKVVVGGFLHTGKTAATGSVDVFKSFEDPSSIVDVGFLVSAPLVYHAQQLSYFTDFLDMAITGFCFLLVLGSFFVIAIQVFVTYLEFALVSTLALIFVPFGVFKHTAFMAEKTFASVISFGVKLMVLGLLVSVGMPLLQSIQIPPEPSWADTFNVVLICLSIAALSWHAPGLAAGLLAGSPTLSAGTAVGTAAGIGVGAGAVGKVGVQATGQTFKGAAFMAGRAFGNGRTSAGKRTATEETTSGGSSSKFSKAGRGAASAASGIGSTLVQGAKAAASPVTNSFMSGQESAPGFMAHRERVRERKVVRPEAPDSSKATSSASNIGRSGNDKPRNASPQQEKPGSDQKNKTTNSNTNEEDRDKWN